VAPNPLADPLAGWASTGLLASIAIKTKRHTARIPELLFAVVRRGPDPEPRPVSLPHGAPGHSSPCLHASAEPSRAIILGGVRRDGKYGVSDTPHHEGGRRYSSGVML